MEVLGDILNKACLFDNDVKTEGQLSTAKIILILVNFGRKMETVLVDIRKLVSESPAGSSQGPLSPLKDTPRKEKPLDKIKTPLLQKPIKELVAGLAEIKVPAAIPTSIPSARKKKAKRDSTSSKPSSQQRRNRKKKKEPSLESEEEEESTKEIGSSVEEEAEPETLPPDKRRRMDTRASDKKKPGPEFKTSVIPKRPIKTPGKGGSSKKKPKEK